MTAPLHFVNIDGTLQELGPGARIGFNAMDGTRQEIILIGHEDLDNILGTISDLEDARQSLLARESDLRSRLSIAETTGKVAQSQVGVLQTEVAGVGQALSDNVMSIRKSIDAVEDELLSKVSGLREALGPVISLSEANADVIEAMARKLFHIVAGLTTLEDADSDASERILGLDMRLSDVGDQIPNVWGSIRELRQQVDTNDRWAVAKIQALYDLTLVCEKGLAAWCLALQRIAIVGVAAGVVSLIVAIASFFV